MAIRPSILLVVSALSGPAWAQHHGNSHVHPISAAKPPAPRTSAPHPTRAHPGTTWSRGVTHNGRTSWPRWNNGAWTWVATPPVLIQTGPTPGYGWSFCPSRNGYYPDIPDCPEGWTMVPAQPPPAAEPPPETVEQPPPPEVASPPPEPVAAEVKATPEPAPPTPATQPLDERPRDREAPASREPIVRWEDASGSIHYTNVPSSIPPKLRSKVRKPRDAGTED